MQNVDEKMCLHFHIEMGQVAPVVNAILNCLHLMELDKPTRQALAYTVAKLEKYKQDFSV